MRIKSLIPRWFKEWIEYIKTCKRLDDSVKVSKNSKVYPEVKIGRYTYINGNSIVFSGVIGRYCSIGYNVQIGPPEHPLQNFSTHPMFYKIGGGYSEITEPPVIESDVWIGSNSVILQGCKVGIGSVIAAGAVVTRDVPPYAIVAGIPARVVKYRFDESTIDGLIASKWWEKEPDQVEELITMRSNLKANEESVKE